MCLPAQKCQDGKKSSRGRIKKERKFNAAENGTAISRSLQQAAVGIDSNFERPDPELSPYRISAAEAPCGQHGLLRDQAGDQRATLQDPLWYRLGVPALSR